MDENKQAVIKTVKDVMSLHGLTIKDLKEKKPGKPSKLKGTKLPVKYKDGDNTWTGRGLVPKWLRGRDREQYRV